MTEQVLDVLGSFRLIRRHWRTVAVFAVVGLVAGGAFVKTHPPAYSATSLVLLPGAAANANANTQSQAPTANDVATDARIATSAAVLGPAGHKVDKSLSLATLQQRVTTASTATGVLAITATAPNAKQAEDLANTVAGNLVTFVTTSNSAPATNGLVGLQAEATQLNRQISDVQQEINTANQRLANDGAQSVTGQQDSNLIATLTAEQSNLALLLDSVNSQITTAELGRVSANQGTEVIQDATAAKASVSTIAFEVFLGVIGGILVGSVYVLARYRRDRRLSRRDDLAKTLGVPVILSMKTKAKRSTKDWVELLERYQPTSSEKWGVREVLSELSTPQGEASQIVIAVLEGDTAALAIATKTAVTAASSGLDTLFAVVAPEGAAEHLESACAQFSTQGFTPRPGLEIMTGEAPNRKDAPELTLTVVVVARNHPIVPPSHGAHSKTLLAVTAGVAKAEDVALVAITAADCGQPVQGIVVANPNKDDQSTGRFPDGTNRSALVLARHATGANTGAALGGAS